MIDQNLSLEKITATNEKLCGRVGDRFPDSSLHKCTANLLEVSKETNNILEWIEKPNWLLRIFSLTIVLVGLFLLIYPAFAINFDKAKFSFFDFIQVINSGINNIIIVFAAIVFLVTIENKIKRKKVIKSVNKLRTIAHVVDMHQLTKDPSTLCNSKKTKHSPERTMTPFLLSRYLDYCSETLSLTSKLSFLYIQNFDDPICVNVVNEFESLTSGLSRKIWQKIMIINQEHFK